MKFFAPYVYLQPGQTVAPLCITALRRPLASVTFTNFEAHLTLNSNLSAFHIPIYLYSGLLSVSLMSDQWFKKISWIDLLLAQFNHGQYEWRYSTKSYEFIRIFHRQYTGAFITDSKIHSDQYESDRY